MSNELNDKSNILENINYIDVIKNIDELIDTNPIGIDSNNNITNIPEISFRVARNLKSKKLDDILNIDASKNVCSTLNILNEDKHREYIEGLYKKIEGLLQDYNVEPIELKYFNNPRHYQSRKEDKICGGIEYYFKNLKGQSYSMDYTSSDDLDKNILREDSIEFSYSNKDMREEIEKALIDYYTLYIEDEYEKEVIINKLKNHEFLVNRVVNFITTLRNGYLKRSLEGPIYMDFILDILKKSESKFNDEEKLVFSKFSNYVKRFDLFEKTVLNTLLTNKSLFEVEYDGTKIDLLHKFRADKVYSFLPIIGILEEATSTTRDDKRENGLELYGISLKRNGNVAKENIRSFEYNIRIFNNIVGLKNSINHSDEILWLNPDNKNRLGNEIVRALLLEYFLINLNDDSYNPDELLKKRISSYKKDFLLGNRKNIILSIEDITSNLNSQLSEIKKFLYDVVILISKYINNDISSHTKTLTKKISILNMILPKDIDSLGKSELLDDNINPSNTHLVKYTMLTDDALPKEHCVYSYEYKITLNSKSVSALDDKNSLALKYNLSKFKQLGIVFLPRNTRNLTLTEYSNKVRNRLNSEMNSVIERAVNDGFNCDSNKSLFYIEYADMNFENEKDRYLYDLSFAIISTIVCNILSAKASATIDLLRNNGKESTPESINISNKLLCVNLMQYTYQNAGVDKTNFNKAQTTIRELRKSLSYSLSMKYTSNSQGFNIRESYNTSNALASMYSRLSRECAISQDFNKIDDLAIITVTSCCTDRAFRGKERQEKVLLLGDVITAKVSKTKKTINLTNYKTFTEYLYKDKLHTSLNSLRDIVSELSERGYKNILYIAKVPYSSNILEQEDSTQMYFMNESVLENMISNSKVNIYPMYMSYSKVQHDSSNLKENENANIYSSLVSQEGNSLEGIVPIIKLFTSNKAHVDSNQGVNKDSYYSKLITYSTINGIYSKETLSKLNNRSILVDEELQNDIKNILILLHSARNAKIPNTKDTLAIKGNPFEDFIGDNSVSKISSHVYKINGSGTLDKTFTTNKLGLISYLTKCCFGVR